MLEDSFPRIFKISNESMEFIIRIIIGIMGIANIISGIVQENPRRKLMPVSFFANDAQDNKNSDTVATISPPLNQ
tara:strand:- start:2154 stop:2378 length:225 start_codon:yes stop_codon:yes gene_type:complete